MITLETTIYNENMRMASRNLNVISLIQRIISDLMDAEGGVRERDIDLMVCGTWGDERFAQFSELEVRRAILDIMEKITEVVSAPKHHNLFILKYNDREIHCYGDVRHCGVIEVNCDNEYLDGFVDIDIESFILETPEVAWLKKIQEMEAAGFKQIEQASVEYSWE